MSNNKVIELFGISAKASRDVNWADVVERQWCPYLDRRCLKNRKSQPEISIGTCSVQYGQNKKNLLICPMRFLERKQIFTDCFQLLTLHEPGNELHIVPELSIPGGNVDYFLASVKNGKVKDFVGIEIQTLDSTGTVWPERQRLLSEKGVSIPKEELASGKSFGINWKMTAKTILVQLHHKIETFEHINKHLVLAAQDHLLGYMRRQFSFGHLRTARLGDPMHIHAYTLQNKGADYRLELVERCSTDTEGIATCLGLQVSPKMDLDQIIVEIEKKLSDRTLFAISSVSLAPSSERPKK